MSGSESRPAWPGPRSDDVDDGGEAGRYAPGQVHGQQVVVAPEHEAQNVAQQIQTPGNQIEHCNNIFSVAQKSDLYFPIETIFFCLLREFAVFWVMALIDAYYFIFV